MLHCLVPPLAREYAARCLTNLATCDSHRMELLKEGAATVLVALIKSYSSSRGRGGAGGVTSSCCYVAARALQNMAKSRAARTQLQVRTGWKNTMLVRWLGQHRLSARMVAETIKLAVGCLLRLIRLTSLVMCLFCKCSMAKFLV